MPSFKISRLRTALKTWQGSGQAKAFEAWQSFRPKYRVTAGGRSLLIPGKNREAIGLANDWHPDWKTSLIHKILAQRPGKFLDIGANIGQTLLDYCASPHRPGYIGFEPNPRCLELISEIIDANHLDDCLITPVGLSAENSVLKLYSAKVFSTDSGASIVGELRPLKECRTQLVPCYRFDDIRDTLEIDAIALMKIDVEGAESFVLGGMTGTLREFRPWVICEVLLRDADADRAAHQARAGQLMETIKKVGYAAMRINKSPDGLAVEGFTPIDAFPDGVWTYEEAENCDYLLVPEADVPEAKGHLLPAG